VTLRWPLSKILAFGALALFSLLWSMAALSTAGDAYDFSSRPLRRADGHVIALRQSGSTSKALSPVVRFSPPTGEPVEFHDPHGSFPAAYTVGDRVPILYDPHEPTRAIIGTSTGSLWIWPVICGAIATAPLLIALAWWLVVRALDRRIAAERATRLGR
jgi:hypothetical protein